MYRAGTVTDLAPNEEVALAHGFDVMTFAYALRNDSESHINPAFGVAGEHAVLDAVPVILALLFGSIAGGLSLAAICGAGAPHPSGATTVGRGRTSSMGGFVREAVGTFLHANAVLNTAVRGTTGRFAPFAICMTVAFCIMAFGPIIGASFISARTLGPAIATGRVGEAMVYVVAPLRGAVAAALLYRLV